MDLVPHHMGKTMDTSSPLILQYHQIGHPMVGGTWVIPRQFRTHLRWLQSHRYPFPRNHREIQSFLETSRRSAIVTFDDGVIGVFLHAFPTLQAIGGVGMVFVVTGFLGRQVGWDASFGRPTYHLDRHHLRMLHQSGWVIGSHSHTHPDLTRLTPKEREWELRTSREVLENLLEDSVWAFSYPFNRWNEAVVEAVGNAGYQWAFTGYNGRSHPLIRYRFGIYTPFLSLGWLSQGPPVRWFGRTVQAFANLSGWARHRWPSWMRQSIGMKEVEPDEGNHGLDWVHQSRQD